MSKYIDADKLIAEIERLKERAQAERVLHPKTILSAKNYLLIKDYDDLLSIITSLQQERPEVDLEKEIIEAEKKYGDIDEMGGYQILLFDDEFRDILRYFYGLRNRALEEAAQHVYESWTGGTMDDVLRDMAELGKVLNARKEE